MPRLEASPRFLVLADRIPTPSLRVADRRLRQLLDELGCYGPEPTVTLVVTDWRSGPEPRGIPGMPWVDVICTSSPRMPRLATGAPFDLVALHGSVVPQDLAGEVLSSILGETPRVLDASVLEALDHPGRVAPVAGDDAGAMVAEAAAHERDRRRLGFADLVLCDADAEADLVRRLAPSTPTRLLPAHLAAPETRPSRTMRRGVAALLSACEGTGLPDEDAARVLIRDVVSQLPEGALPMVLCIEDPLPEVRRPNGRVRVHMESGSVEPVLDAVRAVVALRRYGRGACSGVLAAGASGVPVVASSRVAAWHGLPGSLDGGDDPAALAAVLAELCGSERRWEDAAAAIRAWSEPRDRGRYREWLHEALIALAVPCGEPRRVTASEPWQVRRGPRWFPDPARRVSPATPPLNLPILDEVVTDGLPDPDVDVRAATRALKEKDDYDWWYRERHPSLGRRQEARLRTRRLPWQPLVTLVMAVPDVGPSRVRATVASLQAQTYERWELLLADDCSRSPELLAAIGLLTTDEPRVRVRRLDTRSGGVATVNAALGDARGAFVGIVNAGDQLEPLALCEIVQLLNACPELDVVYTDEHEYDAESDCFRNPSLKPSWSPDLLRSMDYIGHACFVRRSLIDEVGRLRPEYEGVEQYDLVLRLTRRSDRVGHVAMPLYRTPVDGLRRRVPVHPRATCVAERARDALADDAARSGQDATVENIDGRGRARVRYAIRGRPQVGIVIPTRDRVDLLEAAVRSICDRTSYQNLSITIVDNGSTDSATLDYLERHSGPVIRYPAVFNYARMMNLAIRENRSDLVLLMNNDIEVHQGDWLDAMIEHAQRPTVGAVGARLWLPSGQPQHQGIFLGGSGRAHNADFARSATPGDDEHMIVAMGANVANFAAVTGACLMIRPSTFDEVGGFDERLHVAFNDVDLCLKLRARGYEIVYTPFASLVHAESATRGSQHPMENDNLFRERWCIEPDYVDPYSNPNYDQRRRFALRVADAPTACNDGSS